MNKPREEKRAKKKYWILSYTQICPVCGQEHTYKSREYSEKPKDWNERNEIKEVYDYCNSL